MGLDAHEISAASEARRGTMYFWRINQPDVRRRPPRGRPGPRGGHRGARGRPGGARRRGLAAAGDRALLPGQAGAAGALRAHGRRRPAQLGGGQRGGPLARLQQSGELSEGDFPVMLKHPYAASSRGMRACGTLAEAPEALGQWLLEHRVPCLVQQRLRISRDLRITYVGGEIIHGYWRVKPSADTLSSGSASGSVLDFDVPREELGAFVRDFASRTGIDIGGMDIAFPEGGGPPVVFEVSPTFDLNPEPPPAWAQRPYREFKETEDYRLRRIDAYTDCAEAIISYALNRRGRLFVDVDHTVSDARERIRRATVPSWPGVSVDMGRALSLQELLQDPPIPGAAAALASLARDWEVSFLSARGSPDAFEATRRWLELHGFAYGQLILVDAARDKAAWLEDAAAEGRQVLLVDDLTRCHHCAAPEPDTETIGLLQQRGIRFHMFGEVPWPELARLLARASPGSAVLQDQEFAFNRAPPPRRYLVISTMLGLQRQRSAVASGS
ncbi:unnamed protein product [Prorocentrum cordatum]|uniref:ATP-grasp domain-containing protein n=2 Tax=Prorocentrum cordatum TaxID=2364126 RepID=A0ABN9XQG6_9DINO|nr:unnamed protein product [Polarella glacialis]